MSYKVVVTVPVESAEALRQAIGAAGGGRIGSYEFCSFSVRGQGRFRPGPGARPAIGEIGRLETVEEERLEVTCAADMLAAVTTAIRQSHPYEEVALDIYALADADAGVTASAEIRSLAERFFAAAEAGDVDALMACYAPDAVVWHNHDAREETLGETRAFFEGFVALISDLRMTERRLEVFPGGFVQQHVINGVRKDGRRLAVPSCVVARVKAGKIARLDEYFDFAAVSQFRERL
ncbi:MAG TPA: nuclear transport factor 2 family protein [Caulobacteraceae bacterium]|nr:nuclear transport factor 2 family protein [Caulobacteraceae bacterium]